VAAMKEQIVILFTTFLLLFVVFMFTTPVGDIFLTFTGKSFLPVNNLTTTTIKNETKTTVYEFVKSSVDLRVAVADHLIVGRKNATAMDFGSLPVGSLAVGRMYVEVDGGSVECRITGNISKLAKPLKFFVNQSKSVEFNITLENVSIGEVYTGKFECYRPK